MGKTAKTQKNGGAADDGSDRKHLTSREVEKLIEATKGSRNEARDRCLLLLMFRHGFRVSEACGLKLDQVDTESRVLRLKRGLSTTQPLSSDELRAISAWLKDRARMKPSGKTFFVSEQRTPLRRSTVNLLLQVEAEAARQKVTVPQDLWHAMTLYTTGTIVKRELGKQGDPRYRPDDDRLQMFKKNGWNELLAALDGHWQPYLDGKVPLNTALPELVRAAAR